MKHNHSHIEQPMALSGIQRIFAIDQTSDHTRLISKVDLIGSHALIYIDQGVLTHQTFQTVQIGNRAHLLEESLSAMNHSCDPNVHIDTKNMLIKQLRDIRIGDEVTFFYPSTEWSMQNPFECTCGSKQCIGWIAGAHKLKGSFGSGNLKFNDHITDRFESIESSM